MSSCHRDRKCTIARPAYRLNAQQAHATLPTHSTRGLYFAQLGTATNHLRESRLVSLAAHKLAADSRSLARPLNRKIGLFPLSASHTLFYVIYLTAGSLALWQSRPFSLTVIYDSYLLSYCKCLIVSLVVIFFMLVEAESWYQSNQLSEPRVILRVRPTPLTALSALGNTFCYSCQGVWRGGLSKTDPDKRPATWPRDTLSP